MTKSWEQKSMCNIWRWEGVQLFGPPRSRIQSNHLQQTLHCCMISFGYFFQETAWHQALHLTALSQPLPRLLLQHQMVCIYRNRMRCKWTELNCGEIYKDIDDHCSYIHNLSSCEIEAWKKFRPDLCDTGAVLYQLSYQANWELVTLLVRNIPIDGKEFQWIHERSYNWLI